MKAIKNYFVLWKKPFSMDDFIKDQFFIELTILDYFLLNSIVLEF